MNNLKTIFLMVALTLMLMFIGPPLGGKSGITYGLIAAFVINFITYWFSDKIMLRMYGAREVGEAEAPELYSMVKRLALHSIYQPLLKRFEARFGERSFDSISYV